MSILSRTLASLVVATCLMACERSPSVDVTNTRDSVLPATESAKDFGNFVVYFNALGTDQLTPEVASEYGIIRSRSRALLNVSIHRKLEGGLTEAVPGAIKASATNLNGQFKNMTLREIREEAAIYYVGELGITNGEVLIYTVEATPAGAPAPLVVRFQKQFFFDE